MYTKAGINSIAGSRKAQGTLEYAICIFAAALAAFSMFTYVKRGLSGRYADVVRATVSSANTAHYEPEYLESFADVETRTTGRLRIGNNGQRNSTSGFTQNSLSQETYDIAR